jgi:hypothetical protein
LHQWLDTSDTIDQGILGMNAEMYKGYRHRVSFYANRFICKTCKSNSLLYKIENQ